MSSEWSTSPHLVSFSPCLHHAGGNHEPHWRGAAISRAAHDDKEDAGDFRHKCSYRWSGVCVVFLMCFYPSLFLAYPSSTVCAGDLEGLFHWAHWISRGEWGTEMDSFHLSKGVFESPITLELWILILAMVKEIVYPKIKIFLFTGASQ